MSKTGTARMITKKQIILTIVGLVFLMSSVIIYQNTVSYPYPESVATSDINITNLDKIDAYIAKTALSETKETITNYAANNGFGGMGDLWITDNLIKELPSSYQFFISDKNNINSFRVDIITGNFDETIVYINGAKQLPPNFTPGE